MESVVDEERTQGFTMVNPVTFVLQFLASYGWYVVGAASVLLYLVHRMRPRVERWKEQREDAEHHKNPDRSVALLQAIQRARERQQDQLAQASQHALDREKEREERKRAENLERLEKYGTAAGGRRLGRPEDSEYLPLSGGGSSSSYRPPKRSKCGGGGCGR